ncbi:hypothetical protein [Streptomyces lydicus]|uniref:hypothetical protein n=1 Tax=Streptomyces lydicus TaxID=47763 RepID=UPI001F51020D|nr:hypothetical protein [Streptomyces lydicus]MCZ1012658.1 hypothetical protein [Streptomyces lydicus]
MKITRRPTASLATEHFDTETVALLDAVAVELPDFGPVDLDIAFGTPLDMYEPAGTRREMARYAAAVVACDPALRMQQSVEAGAEIAARRDAARDIVASDPSITAQVRERLVDVLLPYAAQLRIAPPATEPLPFAA